ncbi:hypothetical protein [Cytobacillus sp.]|uniref:hypothetical protein n=1 Tax=Cytobacillus sp. TaxID=2675269 RepID=UPI0028BE1DB8|nr:hypothetical protein [Cytobacillus sp.]
MRIVVDFPAPLVHEVFRYYVEKAMDEFDQLHNSDIAFPDKIKQIIFTKKETASQIHEDFYQYLMKEYTTGVNYIKKNVCRKNYPSFNGSF